MIKEKRFLVFDTETCDLQGNVYDIAWLVTNKKGEVYHKEQYLVKETFFDPIKMMGAFYAKKVFTYYIPELIKGNIKVKAWESIRERFNYTLKEFDIDVICAYNLAFDMRVVGAMQEGKFLSKRVDLLDLWTFACETILNQRTYKQLAPKKEWISESGNIRSTAEVAYRYAFGQWDFVEAHTALQDCEIEAQLLKKMLAQKKTIPYNKIVSHPWQLIQGG